MSEHERLFELLPQTWKMLRGKAKEIAVVFEKHRVEVEQAQEGVKLSLVEKMHYLQAYFVLNWSSEEDQIKEIYWDYNPPWRFVCLFVCLFIFLHSS